ncbi:MAG: N-acetylmuramic acid 6-phosphate etherase [Phycisphaerae bacterium]|nr:N-acetylmuramic acid 6-phosphate etherase [Phycisphaerae bacterium]
MGRLRILRGVAGSPSDRGHIDTEQRNPRSMSLDQMSVAECVRVINQEDATVARAVSAAGSAISGFIDGVLFRMREDRAGRLVYFGAGTSGRLGVLDASECPPTFQTPPGMVLGVIAGGDAALRASSEGREDEFDGATEEVDRLRIGERDSVLGIAAGGTTPYVFGALELCKGRGALTGLLTCSRVPTPQFVDHHIIIETGPEIVTGSTRMKAGTATKLVLNTITTTLMVQMGKVYENLMVDLRASNDKLRDRAARIVCLLCDVQRDEAFSLLAQAGGSCKVAIMMHRTGGTRETAEARLAKAGGRLRVALEG